MAAETLKTSRISNAVEPLLISTPIASSRCIRRKLNLNGLKMLIYGPLVKPELMSGTGQSSVPTLHGLYLKFDSSPW